MIFFFSHLNYFVRAHIQLCLDSLRVFPSKQRQSDAWDGLMNRCCELSELAMLSICKESMVQFTGRAPPGVSFGMEDLLLQHGTLSELDQQNQHWKASHSSPSFLCFPVHNPRDLNCYEMFQESPKTLEAAGNQVARIMYLKSWAATPWVPSTTRSWKSVCFQDLRVKNVTQLYGDVHCDPERFSFAQVPKMLYPSHFQ